MTAEEWEERARCKGQPTDLFFPESPDPDPTLTERVIEENCRRCPVRQECLLYALGQPADEDFGIWGGTTEAERKTIRKILDSEAN